MSFDQLVNDYRLLAGVIGTFCAIITILAHRELVHLSSTSPEILRSAGINKIDWWFRCILGVVRLGFGIPGRVLSSYSRFVFRSVGVMYAFGITLSLLTLVGVIKF